MEDAKQVLVGFACGFRDAICGTLSIFQLVQTQGAAKNKVAPDSSDERRTGLKPKYRKPKEPQLWKHIVQCSLLNGVLFGFSYYIFHTFAMPAVGWITQLVLGDSDGVASVRFFMYQLLSYTFDILWVLPTFVISKFTNMLWFQDIADEAYRIRCGRPVNNRTLGSFLADLTFSTVIQGLFLIQSNVVGFVPVAVIGPLVFTLHTSLLYSLYAFEYKWMNKGYELHKRLFHIERNWPYFFGFGLPLTIVTNMTSSFFISGCIFAVLFPFLIISTLDAKPLPGSPRFSMPIFKVVVWLSSVLANIVGIILSKCGVAVGGRPSKAPPKHSSSKKNEISYRR